MAGIFSVETTTIQVGGHVVQSTRAMSGRNDLLEVVLHGPPSQSEQEVPEDWREKCSFEGVQTRTQTPPVQPTVCKTIILYAASVWSEAAKTESYTKGITSDDGGIVPIDLLSIETKEVHEVLID